MMRALLPVAIVAALVAPAAAEKQQVAVLGLEISGKVDYESTNLAKNLTDELRKLVRAGKKVTLAPNSAKDLIDEKINHSCDSEATDCMSTIGKKLDAELLVYGRITRKKKDSLEGYQLDIKLLDVEKKSKRPVTMWIPLEETIGSDIQKPAARAYRDLVVEDDTSGTPLPEGPIVKRPTERGNPGWRKVAYVSGAIALGAGGVAAWSFSDYNKTKSRPGELHADGSPPTLEPGDGCNGDQGLTPDRNGPCSRGGLTRYMSPVLGGVALAALGVTFWATYKGFISKREVGEQQPGVASGKRKRKREGFVVTPIVSPDGAGATIRLGW